MSTVSDFNFSPNDKRTSLKASKGSSTPCHYLLEIINSVEKVEKVVVYHRFLKFRAERYNPFLVLEGLCSPCFSPPNVRTHIHPQVIIHQDQRLYLVCWDS